MVKVLLVDDHELIITAIKFLLDSVENINVIGIASCGEEAIVMVEENIPDVIFMDVKMPGIGGTEACKRILKTHPDIKIIGLSQNESNAITRRFINLGAVGFISKKSSSTEMIDSIQNAMSGETYLSMDVKARMALKKRYDKNNPFSLLSSRELEVVELISQGKFINEMAEIMGVKAKTINTFRYRIYRKLNVKNDVELIRLLERFNDI